MVDAAAPSIYREEWLTRLLHFLRRLFADAGFEITDRLRISCAPPRHGRGEGRHTVCEVWPWWNSADQTWEIFVPASLTDPLEIAAGIASALVHVRTGPGFGAAYRRMAGAVDLKGLKTPVAGPNLRNRINGFLPDLGRYPHAALDGHPQRQRRDHQSRQLRAVCPGCGWPVLTSAARLRRASLMCCLCRRRLKIDPRDAARLAEPARGPGRPRKRHSLSLVGRGLG